MKHIIHLHPEITVAEYKRRFGPVESPGRLGTHRVMYGERIADGTAFEHHKQTMCNNGHRLAGDNLIIKRRGGRRDGEIKRDCRKCHNEGVRERWRRTHPAPWKRQRKCEWCGAEYTPYREWQRFCCLEHQTKAKSKATKQYRPRKCKQCGEKYRPRQSNQRFCSSLCSHRADWDKHHAKHYADRQCRVCQHSFTPRMSTQVLCSDDCRAEDARRRAAQQALRRKRAKSPAPQ